MSDKICAVCKSQVDSNVKYCPHCGSESFNGAVDSKFIHMLFYWRYGDEFSLAKSKIIALVSFIMIMLSTSQMALFALLTVAVIISLIIFLIGYIIHKFISHPSKAKLKYQNQGLIYDFAHLLFYWQDEAGNFILSKTKILSHIVFLIVFIMASIYGGANLFSYIILGIIFETPTFLIARAVHNNTNQQVPEIEKPQKQIPVVKGEVVREYRQYEIKLKNLKSDFDFGESKLRDLIKKCFSPPQITYDKFTAIVDKSHEVFYLQFNSTQDMINMSNEYSSRIESEIKENLNVLEKLIHKLNDFQNELVLTMDKTNDEDVMALFEDMDNLITSVGNYK